MKLATIEDYDAFVSELNQRLVGEDPTFSLEHLELELMAGMAALKENSTLLDHFSDQPDSLAGLVNLLRNGAEAKYSPKAAAKTATTRPAAKAKRIASIDPNMKITMSAAAASSLEQIAAKLGSTDDDDEDF